MDTKGRKGGDMIYPAAVQAWEINTHQIPIHDLGAIPAR